MLSRNSRWLIKAVVYFSVVVIDSDKNEMMIISVEFVLSGATGGGYCVSSRPSAGEEIHEAAVNRGAWGVWTQSRPPEKCEYRDLTED